MAGHDGALDRGLEQSPAALPSPSSGLTRCAQSLTGGSKAASSWWMSCLETALSTGLTEEVLGELTQESIQVICRGRGQEETQRQPHDSKELRSEARVLEERVGLATQPERWLPQGMAMLTGLRLTWSTGPPAPHRHMHSKRQDLTPGPLEWGWGIPVLQWPFALLSSGRVEQGC